MPFDSQGFFEKQNLRMALLALLTDMALAQSFEYKRLKLAYGECAYRTTGREFCGNENHPFEPYPALNDMNTGAPELSVRGGLMALLSGFIEERLMSLHARKDSSVLTNC